MRWLSCSWDDDLVTFSYAASKIVGRDYEGKNTWDVECNASLLEDECSLLTRRGGENETKAGVSRYSSKVSWNIVSQYNCTRMEL